MILPISIGTDGLMNTLGKSPRAIATDGFLNQASIRVMTVGGRDYNAIRADDEEVLEIITRIFGVIT